MSHRAARVDAHAGPYERQCGYIYAPDDDEMVRCFAAIQAEETSLVALLPPQADGSSPLSSIETETLPPFDLPLEPAALAVPSAGTGLDDTGLNSMGLNSMGLSAPDMAATTTAPPSLGIVPLAGSVTGERAADLETGETIDATTTQRLRRVLACEGLEGVLDPIKFQRILTQLGHPAAPPPAAAPDPEPPTVSEREQHLRREIERAVRRQAARENTSPDIINREIIDHFEVSRTAMTEAELLHVWHWLQTERLR